MDDHRDRSGLTMVFWGWIASCPSPDIVETIGPLDGQMMELKLREVKQWLRVTQQRVAAPCQECRGPAVTPRVGSWLHATHSQQVECQGYVQSPLMRPLCP